MFGYITIDSKSLTKEENEHYHSIYCGLCHQLGERYGNIGRATLTYDMTFVTILLSSLYELDESFGLQRCVRHPLGKQPYSLTKAVEYAADMNIFLAYYQALDDLNDDNSAAAGKKSKQLEKYIPQIRESYPRQCETIENCLKELGRMEKADELNPDIPANCFGVLMGETLVWREDEYASTLRRMGAALGRFIYLLDASNDLIADIKKQRYNPLVAQMDTDFTPILTMMISECAAEFEKLPITRDSRILRNILYSGVWTKYKKRGVERDDS